MVLFFPYPEMLLSTERLSGVNKVACLFLTPLLVTMFGYDNPDVGF